MIRFSFCRRCGLLISSHRDAALQKLLEACQAALEHLEQTTSGGNLSTMLQEAIDTAAPASGASGGAGQNC